MKKTLKYTEIGIDRNGIAIRLKKPFFDWANYINATSEPVYSHWEGTIYLIRCRETAEELETWLNENYDLIFRNQLEEWETDEKMWPQKRDINLFKEWFDYQWHQMVYNLEETPLKVADAS